MEINQSKKLDNTYQLKDDIFFRLVETTKSYSKRHKTIGASVIPKIAIAMN